MKSHVYLSYYRIPLISLGKYRCKTRPTKRVRFVHALRWFWSAALGNGAFNNGARWANTTASNDDGDCPKKNSFSPSLVARRHKHSSACLYTWGKRAKLNFKNKKKQTNQTKLLKSNSSDNLQLFQLQINHPLQDTMTLLTVWHVFHTGQDSRNSKGMVKA